MSNMDCSICIPTFNRVDILRNTLDSVLRQNPELNRQKLNLEIIVVDDGSTDGTREYLECLVEKDSRIVVITLPEKTEWRTPPAINNIAFKRARGSIIIFQTDDILHVGASVIGNLCNALKQWTFVLAAVRCDLRPGHEHGWYIHSVHRRATHPFLAAFWRSDIYVIGGFDERFAAGRWYDDDWFAQCLLNHGVQAAWRDDIIGYHQPHPEGCTKNVQEKIEINRLLYERLCASGVYRTETAPWPIIENAEDNEADNLLNEICNTEPWRVPGEM